MKKFILFFLILIFMSFVFCYSNVSDLNKNNKQEIQKNGTLKLIGHASVKIKTKTGIVIYIDPYYKGDYSEPADIILVTHDHFDHNKIELVTKKESTKIITHKEALVDGEYKIFKEGAILIKSLPAANKNHSIKECVGYLLEFDGIKIYHSGDTSYLDSMKNLSNLKITYALFPIDGKYNMDAIEATKVANTIKAKYNIPMHFLDVEEKYYKKNFSPKGAIFLKYGDTINL
jgi:L-ascorbate metabolism protein UlaG (beta-lactamase superfamily)